MRGIKNVAAGALSCNTAALSEDSDSQREDEVESYVNEVVHLSGLATSLEQFKVEQRQDEVLHQVIGYVNGGWSRYLSVTDSLVALFSAKRHAYSK